MFVFPSAVGSLPILMANRSRPDLHDQRPEAALEALGPTAACHAPVPRFPIVGLGVAAHGLAQVMEFITHIPPGSGAAFVIVQHLGASHAQPLLASLQAASVIPVAEISDGMRITPDRVYLVPPDCDLTLIHGVLRLLAIQTPWDERLAIDHFFQALGRDQQQYAVGVIFSGTGTDGIAGLRTIKEHGGLTAAPGAGCADFDVVSESAVHAGVVDVVAAVQQLPVRILGLMGRPKRAVRLNLSAGDRDGVMLARVLQLLLGQTGHDFSLYKMTTLYRRIERRMGLRRLGTLEEYVHYLEQTPGEGALLFKELLIGVTRFFRDPEVWDQLRDQVLPLLMAARPEGGVLRVWIAGCANGEEAYSLAMIFHEALDVIRPTTALTMQVFATDLNATAIERARRGLYPASIAAAVSPERLGRFFIEDVRGYRVAKQIREMVIFAQHSLLADPPFTKLDLVACRNVMIYFTPDVHETLIARFHFSLNPSGILLLGSSESVGAAGTLFTPLSGSGQFYQRSDAQQTPLPGLTPGFSLFTPLVPLSRSDPMNTHAIANLQSLADQLLLQRYAPAAVLVTGNGDIVHISGKTGKYLEPVSGKANWNILAMAREGLSATLSEAFHDAQRQQAPVTLAGALTAAGEDARIVDITVQPLQEPLALRGMSMVVFADVTAPSPAPPPDRNERSARQSARLTAMESALNSLREELRNTREEAQTSREELTSTNEELQSTNEELTTSSEELRTMNEELLRARAAAENSLARYTDLFASAPTGYVIVDRGGVITQANRCAGELLGLGREQPAGGPLALFVIEAERPVFNACCEKAFASREAQVCEVALWRAADAPRRVRISALVAEDGRTCRVVVVDLSEIYASEMALRESEERFRNLADHAPVLIWIAGIDKRCTEFNQSWLDFTGRTQAEEAGRGWADSIHPDDRVRCLALHDAAFDTQQKLSIEYRLRRHDGEFRWMLATGIPRLGDNGEFLGYIGSCLDITERKQAELEKEHERTVLEVLAQGGPLPELLTRLVLSFETLFPGARGSVLLLGPDERFLRYGAAPNLPLDWCRVIEAIAISPEVGSCTAAAATGKNTLVSDIAHDPRWHGLTGLALEHGLRACWSVPILGAERRVLGTFAFYFSEPRNALPAEVATMQRGAYLAGLAIERQQAENALATTTQMLTRTGALAKIGGWQLDLRTMKNLWSLEIFRLYEVDPPAPPRSDQALTLYPAEVLPTVRERLRDGSDHGTPWDVELPLVTAKGRHLWVRIQGAADLENGRPVLLHGTVQDITARKLMEDELRQAHKLEAIGRLAGGIAHDFNNQLTVIQGYGTMALAKTRDEAIAKYLTQVVNAAKRSADLVRQLLTFSRKGNLATTRVDIHALIVELMEVLGRSLNKLIRLRSSFEATDAVIMGDGGLLQNALLNLALNARDAMPSGGDLTFATALVDLDERHRFLGNAMTPGPYLQITVSDTGKGMSPEVQKHLFEPFFSTKAPGQGTGLGLASVYGAVTLHRGGIGVDSSEGRGTTIRIHLPHSAVTTAAKTTTSSSPLATPARSPNGHVLVVDDEESIALFVADSLTSLGHQVVCKQDGLVALEHYREHWHNIDLVILDMNMPKMSGPETFIAMRAVNPQVKVLIMSGYSADGGVQELLRQGALGFIAKPFLPDAIGQQVAQVLSDGA